MIPIAASDAAQAVGIDVCTYPPLATRQRGIFFVFADAALSPPARRYQRREDMRAKNAALWSWIWMGLALLFMLIGADFAVVVMWLTWSVVAQFTSEILRALEGGKQ